VAPTPPLALTCGASTGTVGTAYSSMLVATGGVAPYIYTISAGSISPLVLASGTGKITGTPTTATTLSFTAKVMDSSGITGANTVTAGCSIVVVTSSSGGQKPPALKILCPSSTATVGVYYNSSAVASGGTPPYKYSLAFGTLPDGLTLNATTGAITGTPQTASQTGAFKIEVTDSTGATAYTSCSGSCSGGVNVTYGGSQSQNGWGDKGSNSSKYTSNGLPLNTYGFTTSGVPANLYSSYTWGGTVLGVTNYSNQHQIDTQHFVQFDISAHTSSGATGALLCVTSLDWNASYDVYGSNTLGSRGTLLAGNVPANDYNLHSVPNCNSYKYVSVCAHQGNVQIACLQFTYSCACAIDVSAAQNGWGQQGQGGGNDWWNNQGGGQSGGGQSGGGSDKPGQCGW